MASGRCAITVLRSVAGSVNVTNVSDNFNRAGPGLGANWTAVTGFTDLAIASSTKVAASATSTHCVEYWNANSFQDDQFSEATIVDLFGGSFLGLTLRHQAGASNSFYAAYVAVGGNTTTIFNWTAGIGAVSLVSDAGATWAGGDVVRFEATGTTLTVKQNGATVVSITDATFASGSPGIDIFVAVLTDGTLDDWSAGPLVGAAGVVQLINSDGSVELVDSDGLVG